MRKSHVQRREEIIHAALDIAAEKGSRDATTQAIADRVGIAQATVFRHFRSRDEIFASALEWIGDSLFVALRDVLTSGEPPPLRLRLLIRRHLAFIGRHKGIPRLLLSDRLHLESPHLKRIVLGIMSRYTVEVRRVIEEGIERGEFRDDVDAEMIADMLIALIQGLVLRWSLTDFSLSLDVMADQMWNFLQPLLAPADSAESK